MTVTESIELGPNPRFVAIDEEGYFSLDGLRMADQEAGREWLASMRIDDRGRTVATIDGEVTIVEAFDQPLVALDIDATQARARFPYGYETEVDLETLTFDEWDRFYVRTRSGLNAVLNRAAQSRLFQDAEEFDDDSVTLSGQTIAVRPRYAATPLASDVEFWSNIFRTEEKPRFDFGQEHPLLAQLVRPLKLQRARVLVLGCGAGHDAAWFSRQGHIVTGVDFSTEAIDRAKAKYGESPDLKWLVSDAFQLPKAWTSSFDIIFEHTFYCAISPDRRDELVRLWWKLLSPNGKVMGFAPIMEKTFGPPFGGTEWELRQRLLMPPGKARFRPLLWQRPRTAPPIGRLGRELFFTVERST